MLLILNIFPEIYGNEYKGCEDQCLFSRSLLVASAPRGRSGYHFNVSCEEACKSFSPLLSWPSEEFLDVCNNYNRHDTIERDESS